MCAYMPFSRLAYGDRKNCPCSETGMEPSTWSARWSAPELQQLWVLPSSLGCTQLVDAAHDEAAKQALSALHLTQSIAHAQTGGLASAQDLEGRFSLELERQGIEVATGLGSYKATIVAESGAAFAIGSEKATPLREEWLLCCGVTVHIKGLHLLSAAKHPLFRIGSEQTPIRWLQQQFQTCVPGFAIS